MHKDFFVINQHYNDLNPLSCGYQECKSGHSFGPSSRNSYLIHYVIMGHGTFTSQGKTYQVKEGEIFLIRPGEVTTYTADKKNPWHYIWIGFDGLLAKKLDKLIIPVFPYRANTFSELLKCDEKNNMKEAFLASKLFEIMTSIFDSGSMSKNYERIAHDYIVANYMQPGISVEDIASRLGINRQHLSRLFKAEYNMTMQEFLVQTRLQYAAIFLQRGCSVSQAANLCGYEDVFNFSKMFKKKYGISPKNCKPQP
ncbi:MAG: AraC family transcriptional regulator [Clostridia bacterium]|nr:AraC family transcriptional regulator [Clostridia bacterium]